MHAIKELDEFTKQYLNTALWSTNDNTTESGGYPLDDNYSIEDCAPETIERAIADCTAFQTANAKLIAQSGRSDTDVAHDFWLTRNHHGAGFWDGDYPAPIGKALTAAAHIWGEIDLYVSDDGKLYFS
jgi:hypothetical protein